MTRRPAVSVTKPPKLPSQKVLRLRRAHSFDRQGLALKVIEKALRDPHVATLNPGSILFGSQVGFQLFDSRRISIQLNGHEHLLGMGSGLNMSIMRSTFGPKCGNSAVLASLLSITGRL